MIVCLPFTSEPAQTVTVQLDTVKYQLDVRFNERSLAWILDITDAVRGTLLISGLTLVLGSDLLAPYALQIGHLFVIDENATGLDAGPADLGVRVNVYWCDDDEVSLA